MGVKFCCKTNELDLSIENEKVNSKEKSFQNHGPSDGLNNEDFPETQSGLDDRTLNSVSVSRQISEYNKIQPELPSTPRSSKDNMIMSPILTAEPNYLDQSNSEILDNAELGFDLMELSTPKVSNEKIQIEIYVDFFELEYKWSCDFGLEFRPYIEIYDILKNLTLMDSTDKSHNSNIENHDDSSISVIKGKIYSFKSSKIFRLTENFRYSSITIKLRNRLNSNGKSKPGDIVIGQSRLGPSELNESETEGFIDVMLRGDTKIGQLKVKKSIVKNQVDSPLMLLRSNEAPNQAVHSLPPLRYSHSNISKDIITKFFLFGDEKNRSKYIKSTDILLNKPRTVDELVSFFRGCIENNNDNLIGILSVLNILDSCNFTSNTKTVNSTDKMESMVKFMSKLANENQETFKIFVNLESYSDYNAYIANLHLKLMNEFLVHMKSKDYDLASSIEIGEEQIINICIDTLKFVVKNILNPVNLKDLQFEYLRMIEDSILKCFTLLIESISIRGNNNNSLISNNYKGNVSISFKLNSEHDQIYDNSIQILNSRIILMKMLDIRIDDSEIVSAIVRLFRKSLVNVFNYYNSENTKLNNSAKFTSEMKKLLITQNNGIFITSIRAVINKYHHYPEVYSNCLIIVVNLTFDIDPNDLIPLLQKLSLRDFSACFENYRGLLSNSTKNINILYWTILLNVSRINTFKDMKSYSKSVNSKIINEIILLYALEKTKLNAFLSKKLFALEIHEALVQLCLNLSNQRSLLLQLYENGFLLDMIEFLIHYSNKDALSSIIHQKSKKLTHAAAVQLVINIVLHSLLMILEYLREDDAVGDRFQDVMLDKDIKSSNELISILKRLSSALKDLGGNCFRLDDEILNLRDIFE